MGLRTLCQETDLNVFPKMSQDNEIVYYKLLPQILFMPLVTFKPPKVEYFFLPTYLPT